MKSGRMSKDFFMKPTLVVAKNLLGQYLCRRLGKKTICRMITEVEAYDGFKDKASHASRGLTERNKIMFGPAGYWYVYFIYGKYWMLNIVTGKIGYPAAVLIRGVEGINGPGRVTKFFKIDKKFNGKSAIPATGLWIKNNPQFKKLKFEIKTSPRVGVDYAGPIWSKKHWRFYIKIKNPVRNI